MSKVKLSEIGTFKNGLNFSAERVLSGCKMIGVPDFGDNYLAKLDGLKEVDEDIVSTDYLLQDNDILFVRSNGNKNLVGRAMLIEKIKEKVTFSGFCIRFRITNNNVNPLYMLYLFKSPLFRKLFSNTQQTSISNLNQEILGNIEVELPTIGQQNRIVKVIHGITRKIENNKRINDNLEHQIQLIFDYLFPDVCAGNKHMGDFIIPKRGKSLLSKNAVHGNVPVIAGGLEPSIYHNVANTVAPVVTISSSGANAGFVNIWGIPVWSSDSSYIDSEMSQYVYFWYAYLKRHQNNIYNIQTGSAQPHIYPSHISSLPITDLDYKKIEKYTEIVNPIFSTITKNHVENQHLQSLRDWLLPMLMNGQATISD